MNIATSAYQEELARTRKILENPESTLPALIFSTTGRIVCKITGRKESLPLLYNFIVLALVVQLPTLLLVLLFGDYEQWQKPGFLWVGFLELKLGFLWMVYLELGLFGTILGHLLVFYVYDNMNNYVVEAIQRQEDLRDLQDVFARVGSIKNSFLVTLGFTVFWSVSFSWFISDYIGQFIGIGLLVGTIVFGLLLGPAIYLEGCYYFFITHVGRYSYTLNHTSPAHSQPIYRISRIVTVLIYSIAIFIAVATATVAFSIGAVVLAMLIGWIPTIVYFFASQLSIKRIITNAKWKMLDRIQEQIRKLNDGDITNKENVEAITKLMDYHERIRATPNSALNLGSGMNFAGQLALPIIGANLDKIIKLLEPFFK